MLPVWLFASLVFSCCSKSIECLCLDWSKYAVGGLLVGERLGHGIESIDTNCLRRRLPAHGGFASLGLLLSVGPTETSTGTVQGCDSITLAGVGQVPKAAPRSAVPKLCC